MRKVERPSLVSLFVQPSFGGNPISSATGFIARRPGYTHYWLVTNWHVVAGRHPTTGQALDEKTGAVPDELVISLHADGAFGEWRQVTEPLYDSAGNPLWFEHPSCGRNIDVIALPMTQGAGCEVHAYNPWGAGAPLAVGISRPLSIIGFPFGQTAGGLFPVWLQGWVASEPEIDFNGLPVILVDARTRRGQSGSPVIAFSSGGPLHMESGSIGISEGPVERFVGVYSGRINEQSDIGLVWKGRALVEIIEAAQRGALP